MSQMPTEGWPHYRATPQEPEKEIPPEPVELPNGDVEHPPSFGTLDNSAAAAWESLKRGLSWECWQTVGHCLYEGRMWAMRKANTNQPVGKLYNRAFGNWLDAPERKKWTQEIDRSTRNDAIWCHENKAAIEHWRSTIALSDRLKINHPTTTKRNYEKTSVEKAVARAEKKKQVKIDADELDKLNADLAAYKKKADANGHDDMMESLQKNTAAQSAKFIAGNLSHTKVGELAKALKAEYDRVAAIKRGKLR